MKVVLLSPKGPLYRHRTGIFRRSLRYAPLTLTTLASLAPRELDIEFVIHDEGIEDIPEDIDADLVAMTVITGSAKRAYALSKRFRERGIPVVLGGPHVTLVPHDAEPHADAIVTGYAEESWPQLLRDFAAGQMKRRYVQSPALALEKLPFPRREMLAGKPYLTTHVFEATRACVHDCEFCVVPAAWGRKPLQKPVEDVVADIRQHYAKRIIFIDLNIIADREYAKRLFRALAPLKVKWFGLATSLIVRDNELLDLAAESGCSGLLIGLESISQDNLDEINKGWNAPDKYGELVAKLHERGITLMGCFVFGMDHDEPDVFLKTAKLAVETAIDLPRFAISTPFPGTALYHRLEREGRLLTKDWELYDGQHVVFQPARMSVKELQEGHEAAWRHAYKATSIARRLGKSRLQLPVSIAANLGYRFYARHLHDYYNCDWFVGQGAPTLPPSQPTLAVRGR